MSSKEVEESVHVRCKLCGYKFDLPVKTARRISGKHEGFIPCEKCDSWATVWDTSKVK